MRAKLSASAATPSVQEEDGNGYQEKQKHAASKPAVADDDHDAVNEICQLGAGVTNIAGRRLGVRLRDRLLLQSTGLEARFLSGGYGRLLGLITGAH
jgi:hypothetical protein